MVRSYYYSVLRLRRSRRQLLRAQAKREAYSTSALLLDLVPKYFKPEAVGAVTGHREEITELLKLPFDFIFFTAARARERSSHEGR